MATTVMPKRRRLLPVSVDGLRISIWQAVVLSRLLVLAAGSAGALFTRPLRGWQTWDPTKISTSLGPVGNVLTAAVARWDGISYVTVAQHGYQQARSAVWFPLYPMLIRALTSLVGSPVIAGALISLTTFGIGLGLVHRLTRESLGPRVANTTVLLLAFAPWSFVFSADYTGSLLLMCGAATFYLAQRGRFVLACIAAAAAAVTHVQGILLVAPLALIYWKGRGRTLELRRLWSSRAVALALPPMALASFFLYTHMHGWGWFAPITNQNVHNAGRTLVGPPATVVDSFKDAFIGLRESFDGDAPPTAGFGTGPQNIIYLVVLGLSLLGLVNAWRRLPKEYALYALLAILVCTSSAVTGEPLKGFDRYMLPIFPLWIGAAAWISERRATFAVLAVSITLLLVETVQFTRWVPVF